MDLVGDTVGVTVLVGVLVGVTPQVTLGVGVFVFVTVGVTVFVGVFVGVLEGRGVVGKGIFSIISNKEICAERNVLSIVKIVLTCRGEIISLFLVTSPEHSW